MFYEALVPLRIREKIKNVCIWEDKRGGKMGGKVNMRGQL